MMPILKSLSLLRVASLRASQVLFRGISSTSPGPTTTSSINESEIAKFRTHQNRWWTGAEFAPLRSLNQLRVPFITDVFEAQDSLQTIKLLDIGCGGGLLSEPLARLGVQVIGIDPVAESIEAAKAHAAATLPASQMPHYKACTLEDFASDAANHSTFDGIIASEVLEHVDNIELFLHSALACLRPSGHLFVTTINQTPLAYLTTILVAESIGLIPRGTHEYSKLVPPEALRLVLEQDFGCHVRLVHGMAFNPLTGQWSWTQNQAVNYALMAVKGH